MLMRRAGSSLLAVLSVFGSTSLGRAQGAPARTLELRFVVIVSRHGVRSPTWPAERLNQYSARPWPDWGVPPGHLTPHGANLMRLVGAYDRAYLAGAGLIGQSGCEDAGRLLFWADTDQRTLATARALAAGMLPGCDPRIGSIPERGVDPLFHPVAAGIGRPDRGLAVAAVMGRLGARPQALAAAYRPALDVMQDVLLARHPDAQDPGKGTHVPQPLLDLAASVVPGEGDKLVDFTGPVGIAGTLAQNFLLEFVNAMDGEDLGWGRVDEAKVRQMMSLHTVYSDLLRRTSYLARTNGSNLLSHILYSIQQAATRKKVRGALGTPSDMALVIVGHDTNICNIAGMLNLSWLIEGYQRDDTPPGGALVFELWLDRPTGEHKVRTYYTAQTLEQMRRALPLTSTSPPARAPVFVPGCSTATPEFECSWNQFRRVAEAAIDPAWVKR
jgi:4-phytase/acid phosphatase